MTSARRQRLQILDQCLILLEEALEQGHTRVKAPLANRLRSLLGLVGLVPTQRLEGRRVERVLDDIFALQEQSLGEAS